MKGNIEMNSMKNMVSASVQDLARTSWGRSSSPRERRRGGRVPER
jgi:hypothetical protein